MLLRSLRFLCFHLHFLLVSSDFYLKIPIHFITHMASSSSKGVDMRRLGAEMGIEITSTVDLVKAIKAG